MKILNEKPPIWDSACAAFQINPKNTVFTYGDIIYNPSGKPVSDDVIAHETIHMQQQSDCIVFKTASLGTSTQIPRQMTPELWWGKYLRDPEFRVQQEAWAYAGQVAFLCQNYRDRNVRVRFLMDLARVLSGPLYGSVVSYKDALRLIQKYANISIIKIPV